MKSVSNRQLFNPVYVRLASSGTGSSERAATSGHWQIVVMRNTIYWHEWTCLRVQLRHITRWPKHHSSSTLAVVSVLTQSLSSYLNAYGTVRLTWPFHSMSEHRSSTTVLHWTQLLALISRCFHSRSACVISFSISLRHVFLKRSLFILPRMPILVPDLGRGTLFSVASPIQFLFLICFLFGSWLVLTHNVLLLIVFVHHILRVLLRLVFTKYWIYCRMNFVTRLVSETCIRPILTFEFKMRSFVASENSLDFHILLSTITFPVITLKSHTVSIRYTSYVCDDLVSANPNYFF